MKRLLLLIAPMLVLLTTGHGALVVANWTFQTPGGPPVFGADSWDNNALQSQPSFTASGANTLLSPGHNSSFGVVLFSETSSSLAQVGGKFTLKLIPGVDLAGWSVTYDFIKNTSGDSDMQWAWSSDNSTFTALQTVAHSTDNAWHTASVDLSGAGTVTAGLPFYLRMAFVGGAGGSFESVIFDNIVVAVPEQIHISLLSCVCLLAVSARRVLRSSLSRQPSRVSHRLVS